MNSGFEQAQQLANLWMEMAVTMMSAGMKAGSGEPPTEAQKQMRDAALGAIGQQTDTYMRSPQFLEMVKQSLDASITSRRQLNEFFTQAQHSVQGVAKQDVDTLSLSVRQIERRVLDRIEQLCERLDQVSDRLDALESSLASSNGHSIRDSAKSAAAQGPQE